MESLERPVRGSHPLNVVEKIVRSRVFESTYWKQHCFGLNEARLVDKAVDLEWIGGVSSETNKPTPFLCLIVKMLQIQPEMAIVNELIGNQEYKYMRALGVFYLRLTGKPVDIYKHLEPLYSDYRKLRVQTRVGWELTHMDEFIDQLLVGDLVCDITLPRLVARDILEKNNLLGPRESILSSKLDKDGDGDDDSLSSLSDSDVNQEKQAEHMPEKEKEGQEDGEKSAKKKKKKKDKKKKNKKRKAGEDDFEKPTHHQKKKKKTFIKGLKLGGGDK